MECAFFAAALAVLLVFLLVGCRARPGAALLVVLLCAPAVYLALERGSQFTTADEKRILRETLAWSGGSTVREWNLGTFRTSTAALTPVARIIEQAARDWRLVDRLALLKNFHWYLGFLVFLALGWMLQRALALTRDPWSWALLCYTVLLLPVHLMALKILNYDQFALQLSMLSLLASVIALREDSLPFGYLAVACGCLGAQEKLSASPFLLLAMVFFAYLLLRRRLTLRNTLHAVLAPPLLCFALGGATTVVALATRSFDHTPFRYLWLDLLDPLISWVWVVHRFVFGGHQFAAYRWAHAGVVVATFLISAAGLLILRFALQRAPALRVPDHWRAAMRLGALLAVLVMGVWGTFAVTAYWHPHHPVGEGEYMPPGEINRVVLHFAAPSHGQHLWRATAFHYAVFVNSLPTVLVALALLLQVLRLRAKRRPELPPAADLIAWGALAVPFAYALIYMPFGHRYMNFALLALALTICAELLLAVKSWRVPRRAGLMVLLSAGIVAEILPFAPAYFPFRPIWSPHDYEDARVPIVGRLNPTWLGWGEETMICGETFDRRLRDGRLSVETGQPVLYVRYHADWLNPSPRFQVKSLVPNLDQVQYAAHEYFLVNRTTFVQDACVFPWGVSPEYVLAYRGYAQAWIWRGDRLKEAGYRFVHPATLSRPAAGGPATHPGR